MPERRDLSTIHKSTTRNPTCSPALTWASPHSGPKAKDNNTIKLLREAALEPPWIHGAQEWGWSQDWEAGTPVPALISMANISLSETQLPHLGRKDTEIITRPV